MLTDTLRWRPRRGRRRLPVCGVAIVALALLLAVPARGADSGRQARLAQSLITAMCPQPVVPGPPFTLIVRTPIERGGAVLGERLRYSAGDDTVLRVEWLAPEGQLRRLLVEVSTVTADGLRADLLVFADPGCETRGGRRLLRRADGRAEALQLLDADLAPAAPPEPLDAAPPQGIDPGGVPVAMVDSGVNYLLTSIGTRLARDDEHNLVGHDWWDMDPRPFDAHPAASPFFVQRHGTRTAALMLADAPVAKLVPYRYPRPDMSRMQALVEHADRNGVRIVNLSLGGNRPEEWQVFERAANAHPHMLFIASAGNDGRDIDAEPVYPAALSLPNLVVVTSANEDGTLARGSNWGRRSVHLLLPAEFQLTTGFDGHVTLASGSSYAAARLSALAACLLAANPDWRAAQMREALFARAVPPPEAGVVAIGLLPEPLAGRRGACEADVSEPRVSVGYDLSPPAVAIEAPRARLDISVVLVRDTGWRAEQLPPMVAETGRLLAGCGVVLRRAIVREVFAPRRLRHFSSLHSSELMRVAPPTRPAVFLVDDTLEPEPFEAEAIGRGNGGRRRSLIDSVWMTRAIRQPGLVMAHELVHLLADSGAHSDDPANLMSAESARSEGLLDDAQCARVLERGLATGLLTPLD